LIRRLLLAALACALPAVTTTSVGAAAPAAARPPVVVALVSEVGANVLHRDFRTRLPAQLPAGAPPVTWVDLPPDGPYDARLRAARADGLGSVPEGALLGLRGTRILLAHRGPGSLDVFSAPSHGTGVLSAAASRRSGSNADALYVLVTGDIAPVLDWVARQGWIDIVSTSTNVLLGGGRSGQPVPDSFCGSAAEARRIVAAGKPLFAAAGNGEPDGATSPPLALPEVIRMGGVDARGAAEPDVTRPYDVGDLLSFTDGASAFDDTQPQGNRGTSFAAPRAAGRAALLVAHARAVLGDRGSGVRGGRLAVAPTGARRPSRGPLSDGALTAVELRRLLQDTATTAEPAGAARYPYEGFGALGTAQAALARAVLEGRAAAPDRGQEHRQHDDVQRLRAALTGPPRC